MSKNDYRIKRLMEIIEEKKKDLGVRQKANWRTNGRCTVGLDSPTATPMNINAEGDIKILVNTLAYMLANFEKHCEAAKLLQVPVPEVLYDGYTLEDWVHDFQIRAKQLLWTEEQKKLKELEATLESLISEDAKTERTLDKITQTLGVES